MSEVSAHLHGPPSAFTMVNSESPFRPIFKTSPSEFTVYDATVFVQDFVSLEKVPEMQLSSTMVVPKDGKAYSLYKTKYLPHSSFERSSEIGNQWAPRTVVCSEVCKCTVQEPQPKAGERFHCFAIADGEETNNNSPNCKLDVVWQDKEDKRTVYCASGFPLFKDDESIDDINMTYLFPGHLNVDIKSIGRVDLKKDLPTGFSPITHVPNDGKGHDLYQTKEHYSRQVKCSSVCECSIQRPQKVLSKVLSGFTMWKQCAFRLFKDPGSKSCELLFASHGDLIYCSSRFARKI